MRSVCEFKKEVEVFFCEMLEVATYSWSVQRSEKEPEQTQIVGCLEFSVCLYPIILQCVRAENKVICHC